MRRLISHMMILRFERINNCSGIFILNQAKCGLVSHMEKSNKHLH